MLKTIFKAPIHIYRTVISPWLMPSCRFSPTCSAYALEAIEKHGIIKGIILSTWRILRCNPWNSCTHHDPVAETIDWMPRIGYKR